MIRVFLFLAFSLVFLDARDNTILQKQNVLYIQNIIEAEEMIAQNYEKYLLNEFAIPSIGDLKTKNYLGENFDTSNKFGEEIGFFETNGLKLKFAIQKAQYLKKDETGNDNYIIQLYKRDLYRDFTTVYLNVLEENTLDNSYVEFKLKSAQAQNIYKILTSGAEIIKKSEKKDCENSKYCIEEKNLNVIKYMIGSDFIAYNLKEFENGDVTVSNVDPSFFDNDKFKNLRIGAYVFGKNKRHIRLSGDENIIKEVK